MFDVKLRPDTEHDNMQMAVPNAHRIDVVIQCNAARNFGEGDDFAGGGDGGNDC